MTKLERDLKLAHDLIEDKAERTPYYYHFYRMWAMATLNIKAYLEPFDLEDKTVATIQGSSDHVFELALKKPKKIIGVDTNPLTEYYYFLKDAAFAVLLTPEEFLKFFRWYEYPDFTYNNNKHAFDKNIYQEISKYLTHDYKTFWNDLFDNYDPIKIRTKLFNETDEYSSKALCEALNYLSEENYEYIRQNRDKIDFSFLNADIRVLADELPEDIDFITLSNVILYANKMFPLYPLEYFKEVVKKIATRLKDDGVIVVGYLYDIENELDARLIYKAKYRDQVFIPPEYSYHTFERMNGLAHNNKSNYHDATLIYTKK
ncbi:MAG: DUF3419 family protein [Erysipelotrichales bacterium]|nr:DUF3419 family protein [Erysipelotrichales bacterium]